MASYLSLKFSPDRLLAPSHFRFIFKSLQLFLSPRKRFRTDYKCFFISFFVSQATTKSIWGRSLVITPNIINCHIALFSSCLNFPTNWQLSSWLQRSLNHFGPINDLFSLRSTGAEEWSSITKTIPVGLKLEAFIISILDFYHSQNSSGQNYFLINISWKL